MIPVNVTAYALQGPMADGKWTHFGACAVYTSQFPFGTLINIYNRDGSFNRQCIAEDTGGAISYGHIDLAFPGDESAAIQWGRQYLYARVARWGW
jgi:3D (Asp-Asp-Asp) domain-containing protein